MAPQTIQHAHEWHGATRRYSAHYTHAHLIFVATRVSLSPLQKKAVILLFQSAVCSQMNLPKFFPIVKPPLHSSPPPKKIEKRFFRHFLGLAKGSFLENLTNSYLKPWNILKYQVEPPLACSNPTPKKKQAPEACQNLLHANFCWNPIDLYKFHLNFANRHQLKWTKR